MRALAAAVLMSLVALPAFPQQTLVESIEVRVANIDVVVRDRAGNPVTGLTKDDFELGEDGVRKTITNFYEVRRGEDVTAPQAPEPEVPLELRQRRIVVFVDSASLTPSRTKAVLDSIEKFIDARMRGEDRAMLVSWRLGLHVVTPFTNDKESLKRGLAALARFGPAGESSQSAIANVRRAVRDLREDAQRGDLSWGEAYSLARGAVDKHGERLLAQQQRLIEAVGRVATTMAGLEGKKVLVFVGEHLPQHPAAELYRHVYDEFSPYMGRAILPPLEITTGLPGNAMPKAIAELAKQASADGVTIYTIGAAATESDISAENSDPADYGYSFSRDANTASALETIAEITGGVAITGTSNFDLALDTITRDLASYYSLGYKPSGSSQTQHKIVVKTKNRAYSVRARQTFVTKSTDDQMTDRAIANLYIDPARNEWPISVRTGLPKKDGSKFIIPLQVVIPSTITLLPVEKSLTGSFVLYFVVGTGDGAISSVMRRPEALKIPPAAEGTVRAKPMTFTTAIRVNAGESTLSVAIIDELSGATGFARANIVAR